MSRPYLKELPPGHPPYRVDDLVYKRFGQRNNLTASRPNWDESVIQYYPRVGSYGRFQGAGAQPSVAQA